jgi:hypothetical protein
MAISKEQGRWGMNVSALFKISNKEMAILHASSPARIYCRYYGESGETA